MSELDERVAGLLRRSGLTLACAESCSGGLLAKRITDIPGSSDYFLLATVTYADRAKEQLLEVPPETLATHGAVSAQTAVAMARGVKRLAGSDLALATTGIAGPGGGSPAKPVGTVYIAIADNGGSSVERCNFAGDRAAVREATATAALELLARRLSAAGE